jgi:hypothetical protein
MVCSAQALRHRSVAFLLHIGDRNSLACHDLIPLFAAKTIRDFVQWIYVPLFGVVFLSFVLFVQWFKFRREYSKSTQLHLRTSLNIDGTGVHYVTSKSDSRLSWQLYKQYCESKSTFLFIPKGNQAFIPIPKREFTSFQIDELRTILSAPLPRK